MSKKEIPLPPCVMQVDRQFIPAEVLISAPERSRNVVQLVGKDDVILFTVTLPQNYSLPDHEAFIDVFVSLEYLRRKRRGKRRKIE